MYFLLWLWVTYFLLSLLPTSLIKHKYERIEASTPSLKTVHRTVFLTVAFKSCHPIACCIKKKRSTSVLLFFLVRVTGLEPARRWTLEPKSSASANSATPAYILFCVLLSLNNDIYYILWCPKSQHFFAKIFKKLIQTQNITLNSAY